MNGTTTDTTELDRCLDGPGNLLDETELDEADDTSDTATPPLGWVGRCAAGLLAVILLATLATLLNVLGCSR